MDGSVVQRPEVPPTEGGSQTAKLPGAPRATTSSTADAGSLKDVRLVSIGPSEARLLVGGAPRTVRVGQSVLGDVVRAIGDGRIILRRLDPTGGESIVVMSFDGQGRATVRVITQHDRTVRPSEKP
jgi:hypothetical protein